MIEHPRKREPPPTVEDASRIVTNVLQSDVAHIRRFPAGLAHYVFDTQLVDGRQVVVRLTHRAQATSFASAIYWSQQLRSVGVPLPAILYADVDGREQVYPTIIMERLPGTDLGDVYPTLSRAQKQAIAECLVEVQERVATLPPGSGFGDATSPTDPTLASSWKAVLDTHLERSRQRIVATGFVDPAVVERVQRAIDIHDAYWATVAPTAFLDDTTTKNVLIANGHLCGIVDVDTVCFGDPLRTPALTQTALLSLGYDTDYVDAWLTALGIRDEQRAIFDLYVAIYAVDFLSEIGHRFNRDEPAPIDRQRLKHLLSIANHHLR